MIDRRSMLAGMPIAGGLAAVGLGSRVKAAAVLEYGADGAGTLDSLAAFRKALGENTMVHVPAGVYRLSGALVFPADCSLVGDGSDNTILLFEGASNGFEYGPSQVLNLQGLNIRTANPRAGKAIQLVRGGFGEVRDVKISVSPGGRWAYGVWANDWQTSNFFGLRMYQSCTVGVHLEHACNANHFWGCEYVGGSGGGTFERALEMTNLNSLARDSGTFEAGFHGCTFQGYCAKSLVYMTGASALMDAGCHLENTNRSPSDGADVWLDGASGAAIVNAKFVEMQGGSFGTEGPVRNLSIIGGEVDSVSIGRGCDSAALLAVRYASLNDRFGQCSVLGCSTSTGAAAAAHLGGAWGRMSAGGTSIAGWSEAGIGYTANQSGSVVQRHDKSATVSLDRPTGTVIMSDAALAGSATVTFTLANRAVALDDHVLIQHISGGTMGAYGTTAVAGAGAAKIYLRNLTEEALAEPIVLKFSLLKASLEA